MAKKRFYKNRSKKKYSWGERKNFHTNRVKKALSSAKGDTFAERYKNAVKNKKVQYSEGFTDFCANLSMDESGTESYRAGYFAAEKARKKADTLKF